MIRSASCRSCRHCDHRNSFSKNVARCFSPHFPRGRDDLRVVRLNTSNFQVCSLLPQVSAPQPQSPPTLAPIVRSGSTVFHLSSSAPLRLCASQGTLWRFNPPREGRPPRRPPQCRCRSTVFHLSRSAPPRLCASQGILWRFNPTREGRPPRRPKALLPPCRRSSSSRSIDSSIDRLKSGLLSPDLRSPKPHHSLCSFFLEQSCWMRHTHCFSAKAFS